MVKNALIVVLLVALTVALVVPAVADKGDNMIVGEVNGAKGWQTSLYSTNPTATLTLVNNRAAGGPALNLSVKKGPPMVVDTTARVMQLNSDYVDGYSANALTRIWTCSTADAPDDADDNVICTRTFTLARPAYAFMVGGFEMGTGATIDHVACRFLVDGSQVVGSYRKVGLWNSDGSLDNDCTSSGGLYLSAGTHTVVFEAAGVDSQTVLGEASAQMIISPFNPDGMAAAAPPPADERGITGN
jgi:hypothetical protein